MPLNLSPDGLGRQRGDRECRKLHADPERRHLCFRAEVAASPWLAVLLSVLGAVGAACLGLVLRQLLPQLGDKLSSEPGASLWMPWWMAGHPGTALWRMYSARA